MIPRELKKKAKKKKKDALLNSSFSYENLEKLIEILDHFKVLLFGANLIFLSLLGAPEHFYN